MWGSRSKQTNLNEIATELNVVVESNDGRKFLELMKSLKKLNANDPRMVDFYKIGLRSLYWVVSEVAGKGLKKLIQTYSNGVVGKAAEQALRPVYEEYYTKQMSNRFRIPNICACCGDSTMSQAGFTITGVEYTGTYEFTKTVHLPACADCIRHRPLTVGHHHEGEGLKKESCRLFGSVGSIRSGHFVFKNKRFAYEFARLNGWEIVSQADLTNTLADAY
jgi:hypothetical protein